DDVAQRPGAVAADHGLRRRRPAEQLAVAVELEDAHVVQQRAALSRADVDRIAALACGPRRVLLDPRSGTAEPETAAEGSAHLVADARAERRDVVADNEREGAEGEGQAREKPQCPPGAESAGAQDRVLRRLRL